MKIYDVIVTNEDGQTEKAGFIKTTENGGKFLRIYGLASESYYIYGDLIKSRRYIDRDSFISYVVGRFYDSSNTEPYLEIYLFPNIVFNLVPPK